MGFSCGIIGLPNVGKSTLFNALTQNATAAAENYPFCTIEPNLGETAVPDSRLKKLAEIENSKQIIPALMRFVDIAGLVRSASKGEGLGNKFLSHIRECEALIHVVRCFDDDDITHVEGSTNPVRDIELIETELALSDLESLEKRKINLEKKSRGGDKEVKITLELVEQALNALHNNQDLKKITELAPLQLITAKPQLYIANVSEEDIKGNDYTKQLSEFALKKNMPMTIITTKTEAELIALNEVERTEYLQSLGVEETGLERLIKAGFEMLGLITFFTAGEKETRAWTIPSFCLAPKAAGSIHTDFEKKFIRAEIISYDDFVKHNGATGAAKAGKMRLEGKEYQVCDSDVIYFRIGN